MASSVKQCSHQLALKRGKISFLQHYWWVFLLVAICFGIYAHAAHKKRAAIDGLKSYLDSLKKQKESLEIEKRELQSTVDSHSDPAWIELTLMKGLGLVPEGKVKVYFDSLGD